MALVKFLLALFFWGIFVYVIFQIPYPNSLTQASVFQLSAFFTPLFLALTSTINIFFKFLLRSVLISAALMVFLTLQALQTLSLLTFILTSVAFGLFISYFKKKTENSAD